MSSFETKISDLLRACDIISKRLHSFRRIPSSLIYSSSLITVYALFLILSYFIKWNQFIYVAELLVGLLGSTIIFVLHILILRKLNNHIEVSKYLHSHIEDMLKIINLGLRGESYNYLIKFLAIEKSPLKYMPVLLIVPYLSLLIAENPFFSILLILLFHASLSILLFFQIELFNRHIVYENKITRELFNRINNNEYDDYEPFILGLKDVLLSIISLGTYLIALYAKVDAYLDEHIVKHRKNYRLFKINYIRKSREFLDSTQQ
ncbi:hypothetical protein Smar_0211 [Staphylothermus marinus F1]|uniref:Uncharacterized protein n=1 Tax=Staphylothermus marinus (strain ATCC 43588 / DSM 3639 / JCM 9404 / F1) TaxID=399550 RepID=A3DL14_STAMF|nr:hypothetical protein [Staphylothermus marinus]ABN69324.1 hypothetical protein Smar_0211 [Staphylothermus marinus F1]